MGRAKQKQKLGRISPKIPVPLKAVAYSDLVDGDTFLSGGYLWILSDLGDQEAVRLSDGQVQTDFCEARDIVPVDVKITWTKK